MKKAKVKKILNKKKIKTVKKKVIKKITKKANAVNTKTKVDKGTKITKDMLRTVVTKQDGGLLPDQYYNVIGSIANKDMEPNHVLLEEDLTFEK